MLNATIPMHPAPGSTRGSLIARLERLPVSRQLFWTRIVVGTATFFDAYTALAIAYAVPVLVREWGLSTQQVGYIISSAFVGQMIGAVFFGWLAERIGRLRVLTLTVLVFAAMSIACLFAWNVASLILFRFIQGIGTGGEVPVASAYINEFVGAKNRGRFFLIYEVIFPVGLLAAGLIGYFLVPTLGWKAMFYVGIIPILLTVPFRLLMPESPRWLISKGRLEEAESIIGRMERNVVASGLVLPDPVYLGEVNVPQREGFAALFQGIYRRRTFMLWGLWLCVYSVLNGLITWLPTLYRQTFNLPLDTSIMYGFLTSAVAVAASLLCALYIDRVGRKRWYTAAFWLALVPLLALAYLGTVSAIELLVLATCAYAILQTIAFSLYLYSAELYPTRLRAVGTGLGSAWLRVGSAIGPITVGWLLGGYGVGGVFVAFSVMAAAGGVICIFFAIETRGRVLEELSP